MAGFQRLPIFLSLACLICSTLPHQRADAAFASANTQAEFNWAYAQYRKCKKFPNAQCWNLVLDPFGVTNADAIVQFDANTVAASPNFVAITPGDFYNFPPGQQAFVVIDPDTGQGEVRNLSIILNDQDVVPFENVDFFEIEFIANPNFVEFGAFDAEVSSVFVEDELGNRLFVPPDMVVQAGQVMIEPILIPCDLGGSLVCDVADIDMLTMAIADGLRAEGNYHLDINNDFVLNLRDLDAWRRIAATQNGLTQPYPIGDTNLDGKVDAIDLNNLGLGWRQDNDRIWSRGDFNASGFVDALDLNELALNWRVDVNVANAVPEPHAFALLLSAVAILATRRPQRH